AAFTACAKGERTSAAGAQCLIAVERTVGYVYADHETDTLVGEQAAAKAAAAGSAGTARSAGGQVTSQRTMTEHDGGVGEQSSVVKATTLSVPTQPAGAADAAHGLIVRNRGVVGGRGGVARGETAAEGVAAV